MRADSAESPHHFPANPFIFHLNDAKRVQTYLAHIFRSMVCQTVKKIALDGVSIRYKCISIAEIVHRRRLYPTTERMSDMKIVNVPEI